MFLFEPMALVPSVPFMVPYEGAKTCRSLPARTTRKPRSIRAKAIGPFRHLKCTSQLYAITMFQRLSWAGGLAQLAPWAWWQGGGLRPKLSGFWNWTRPGLSNVQTGQNTRLVQVGLPWLGGRVGWVILHESSLSLSLPVINGSMASIVSEEL